MPATYEPIATTTLGTAASTITFSSIPATYTDLRLVLVYTLSTSAATPQLRFNADTLSRYNRRLVNGNGVSVSVLGGLDTSFYIGNQSSTTVPQMVTMDVFSYAGSTNKSSLFTISEDKNGSGSTNYQIGTYASTSAITEINLLLDSAGNYSIGTTATLYGILKA